MIVVVGFTMDAKNAIGYRDFDDNELASQYVFKLLLKGAQVISIRVVEAKK